MATALLVSLIPAGAASARTEWELASVETFPSSVTCSTSRGWRAKAEAVFGVTLVPKTTCREVTDPPADASAQIKAVRDACNLLITAYGEEEGRRQCQELVRKLLPPQSHGVGPCSLSATHSATLPAEHSAGGRYSEDPWRSDGVCGVSPSFFGCSDP